MSFGLEKEKPRTRGFRGRQDSTTQPIAMAMAIITMATRRGKAS